MTGDFERRQYALGRGFGREGVGFGLIRKTLEGKNVLNVYTNKKQWSKNINVSS